MRGDIEKRFFNQEAKYPDRSSLVNFMGAIKSTQASHKEVRKFFLKLVHNDDYEKINLGELVDHAFELSTPYSRKRGTSQSLPTVGNTP